MSTADRRPALLLAAVGVVLGLAGFLLQDERLAVLAWLVAVPMVAGGLVTIAWGNARGEVLRRLQQRD